MEVFRISRTQYAHYLIASGAANRWNYENEYVIYTAGSRSLATLEMVVHRSAIQPNNAYTVVVIHISDEEALFSNLQQKDLPQPWRQENAYPLLQQLGSHWYQNKSSLVLRIPSAVIPNEYNYIINTAHPDFQEKNIKIVNRESYFWDDRLII